MEVTPQEEVKDQRELALCKRLQLVTLMAPDFFAN